MRTINVSTKKQLKVAKDNGYDEIIVIGELANKLKKAKKITQLSAATITILTATFAVATVTAPETGGVSYMVAAPIAATTSALTGVEIATIIVAATIGIGFIIALFLGYEEIEYRDGRLILRKRQTNTNNSQSNA